MNIKAKPQLTFRGEQLIIEMDQYASNNNTCLHLVCLDGEPYTKATVNTELRLPPYQFLIKDYGENQGVAAALVEADLIVRLDNRPVHSGYVDLDTYQFTQRGSALFDVPLPREDADPEADTALNDPIDFDHRTRSVRLRRD
jgi:hypothetical protein